MRIYKLLEDFQGLDCTSLGKRISERAIFEADNAGLRTSLIIDVSWIAEVTHCNQYILLWGFFVEARNLDQRAFFPLHLSFFELLFLSLPFAPMSRGFVLSACQIQQPLLQSLEFLLHLQPLDLGNHLQRNQLAFGFVLQELGWDTIVVLFDG